MKKNFIYLFFFVAIYFVYTINVSAGLSDFSGGSAGNVGNLSGGEWYPDFVGLKISIVDEKNKLEDVEIFLDQKTSSWRIVDDAKLCSIMKPKTHYGNNISITWTSNWSNRVYVETDLPSSWLKNNDKVNIYEKLKAGDYQLLKKILKRKKSNGDPVFETLANYIEEEHYIIIEPMTYIGGYYGTAFELLNAFAGNVSKCDRFFCYWYTGAVFGGDSDRTGVLYDTLYTTKVVNINNDLYIRNITNWIDTYIKSSKEANWKKRNRCMKSRSCGRGLGVFKYSDVFDRSCKTDLASLNNPTKKQLDALYEEYGYDQLQNYSNPKCDDGADENLTCNQKLNLLTNPTPQQLIALYKEEQEENGKKYNGLLNFDSPKCKEITCEENYENSCMNALHSYKKVKKTTFETEMDFSCAKQMPSSDGTKTLYCKSLFQLSSSRNIDELVKSGMLIYGLDKDSNEEDGPIMTGDLLQKCYSETTVGEISFKRYDELVSDVTVGQKLNVSTNEGEIERETVPNSGGYVYKKNSTAEYYYPNVYAVIGTGKIVPRLDDPQCIIENGTNSYNVCKLIGKGIATNFNSDSDTILNFKYKYMSVENDTINEYIVNDKEKGCKVSTEPEIVSCEDSGNCKLNLEFRTIESESYDKAFSGKNGNTTQRNTGTNWKSALGKKVLNYRNDSKNKKKSVPLYTITLDSETIKNIRNYNKNNNNKYDDFKFDCDSGICYSQFLLSDIFTSNNLIKPNRDDIDWLKNYVVRVGDIGLDGRIDTFDSTDLRICIHDSSKCDGIDKTIADVNLDGILDCYDAVYIDLYIARIISTLPVKSEELTENILREVEKYYQICIPK